MIQIKDVLKELRQMMMLGIKIMTWTFLYFLKVEVVGFMLLL